MSLRKARLVCSLWNLGARLRDALLAVTLLAGCSDPGNCPSPSCPDCTCDAELVKEVVDDLTDDSPLSCGSLSSSSCDRAGQCVLQASCATTSACRGNNCNDACDVVTRCVESR